MGSFTPVNQSISIDLNDPMQDTDECQHFSLRGYVSNMREIDWKKCWPFPIKSEERPPFPPLEVPQFRWWNCQSCPREITSYRTNDQNDQRTSFDLSEVVNISDTQQVPMPDNIVATRDIDLNIPIDLRSDSDCLQKADYIENKLPEVLSNRIPDPQIGLENNLNFNLTASSIPDPEICPNIAQEVNTKKKGHEGDEAYDVELVTRNLNNEHPSMERLLPESTACGDVTAMGNTDKCAYLDRKKPQKIRLVTDILRENQEPRTDQNIAHGSTSHNHFNMSTNSQAQSILPDKVVVQEDLALTKRSRGRKRKFHQTEKSKEPEDMRFHRIENGIQNLERDVRSIEIQPSNISEDVPMRRSSKDGMKGHQHKPEHDRSQTMFKNDIAEKECESETPAGFYPHASIEKRIDNFSKGKGKMVQTDVELSILNTNMTTSMLPPSIKGTPNGERFEEGLQLSPNLYSSIEACNKKGTNQSQNPLPFSLPEGSSKPHQLIRKGIEPNSLIAYDHNMNSHSGKWKGVYLEETNGSRNQAKNVPFYDLTTDEPEQDTHDDIPTEVVELMVRTQINRSMADAENKSCSLQDKSTQMEKHLASNNSTQRFIRRELNWYPKQGSATNSFYPYGGYQLGLNNLCKTQSPFGFEVLKSKSKPSSGVYFSPIVDINKFNPAGTSIFKRSIVECGPTDATLKAWGGSELRKNILQQEHHASHPWPTLTRSNASLRFATSQPKSSNNMDITSLQSGSMSAIPTMNLHNLLDSGKRSSTTTPFNAVVGAQLLQRAFHPRDNINKMKIGPSISDQNMSQSRKGESSKLAMQDKVRWPSLQRELKELASKMDVRGTHGMSGPLNNISESLCELNKNPADFIILDEENAYMINGEDLQF